MKPYRLQQWLLRHKGCGSGVFDQDSDARLDGIGLAAGATHIHRYFSA